MPIKSEHRNNAIPPLRKATMAAAIMAAVTVPTITVCAQTDANTDPTTRYWIENAKQTLATRQAIKPNKRRARNVILFVADGMDPTTITAARIYDGQSRGEPGEENLLSFETLPHLAMAKTYTTNTQTPDSAGTMSAMVTGVKTKNLIISLTDAAIPGQCTSQSAAMIKTIGEMAEQAGMHTGIISTTRLTHATPAAVYSHSVNRNWEHDGNLTDEAHENGCPDIASQLIDFAYGDGIDIALGGGRRSFLPDTMEDPEYPNQKGRRKDGRNLVAEWQSKSDHHQYVWDLESFNAAPVDDQTRLLGLFEPSHMEYELDRTAKPPNEPSLAAMTEKAIAMLSARRGGYFLMVEAGRVDHAHHRGNARRALHDTQAFAEAIKVAMDKTKARDTLIIVTADHGHTMSFGGYPGRGNNILGLVRSPYSTDEDGEPGLTKARDGKPYTTLTYGNGPGAVVATKDQFTDGRPALTDEIVAKRDYQQQATIPLGSETHGGQDVTIYARGPQAYLFGGIVEQSYIFHVIEKALNLKKRAGE